MDTLSYKTISANKATVTKEWVVVDATDQILGRFAVKVAKLLRGKYKPNFTPHVDCGDNVIIINADKMYFDHGMFHGNFNPKRNRMMNSIRCLLLYSFQGKCQELADECNYYMKTEKKNNEYVVTLTPKRKKLLDFSLVVLHYSMSYKLKEIEYTATVDDHSSYTIRNVKYNGPIKKEIFQF